MKTVAPQWQDDETGWQRFERIAAAFPDNAQMGVAREFGGAGIFGQSIKARWSFIRQTLELERKASLIPADVAGPVWLLLCSDRSAWHLDELEDFADFYRTGRFREDDWARNAIAEYMTERG